MIASSNEVTLTWTSKIAKIMDPILLILSILFGILGHYFGLLSLATVPRGSKYPIFKVSGPKYH